ESDSECVRDDIYHHLRHIVDERLEDIPKDDNINPIPTPSPTPTPTPAPAIIDVIFGANVGGPGHIKDINISNTKDSNSRKDKVGGVTIPRLSIYILYDNGTLYGYAYNVNYQLG